MLIWVAAVLAGVLYVVLVLSEAVHVIDTELERPSDSITSTSTVLRTEHEMRLNGFDRSTKALTLRHSGQARVGLPI